MPNPWIIHVKEWSKANNKSYACSISEVACKEAYQKKKTRTNLEKAKKPSSIRQAFPKQKTPKESSPNITGTVSKTKIDKMQKDIEELREKAGRIAEDKGRVTQEVTKLMEKIKKLTMERLQLVKEYKKQQKK